MKEDSKTQIYKIKERERERENNSKFQNFWQLFDSPSMHFNGLTIN